MEEILEFNVISDVDRKHNPTKVRFTILEEHDQDNVKIRVQLIEYISGGTIIEDTIRPYNKSVLAILQNFDAVEKRFVVDEVALAAVLKQYLLTLQTN